MNPALVFALQTTRVPANDVARGGIPALTPDMAAHYCQNMPEHWYLAARLKWASDWSGAQKLEYKLWDDAVSLKIKERWRIPKRYEGKMMLRKLAGLAIAEIGDPKRYQPVEIKIVWMQVSKSTWHRQFRKKYEAIYSIINEWTNDAWRYVQKQKSLEYWDSNCYKTLE